MPADGRAALGDLPRRRAPTARETPTRDRRAGRCAPARAACRARDAARARPRFRRGPRARCARAARRRAPPSARGGAGTRRPPCRCGKRARSSAETVYPRPEPGKAARLPRVTFGVLTVIVIAGLGGPLLSASERILVPVVVGELLAGLVIGRTGFHLIHPADPTLAFMAAIGFAMLMFGAGMKVPLRTPQLGTRLVRGTIAAAIAGVFAGVRRSRSGQDLRAPPRSRVCRRARERVGCGARPEPPGGQPARAERGADRRRAGLGRRRGGDRGRSAGALPGPRAPRAARCLRGRSLRGGPLLRHPGRRHGGLARPDPGPLEEPELGPRPAPVADRAVRPLLAGTAIWREHPDRRVRGRSRRRRRPGARSGFQAR